MWMMYDLHSRYTCRVCTKLPSSLHTAMHTNFVIIRMDGVAGIARYQTRISRIDNYPNANIGFLSFGAAHSERRMYVGI